MGLLDGMGKVLQVYKDEYLDFHKMFRLLHTVIPWLRCSKRGSQDKDFELLVFLGFQIGTGTLAGCGLCRF